MMVYGTRSISGLIAAFLVLSSTILTSQATDITVGITFWGDVRSHILPWKPSELEKAKDCKNEATPQQQVGSISRVVAAVDDMEKDYLKSVTKKVRFATGNLVSGETGYLSGLQGLGWKTFGGYVSQISVQNDTNVVSRSYTPDYMSLGVKEFESGVGTTQSYVVKALEYNGERNTTIVLSNSNCNTGAVHGLCDNITAYSTMMVQTGSGNLNIGVVGFVNPSANSLADAGPVVFGDPDVEIEKVLSGKLSPEPDYIIAVGTGTYDIAKKIIEKNSRVKLVIYGGGYRDMKEPEKYKDSYIATTGAKCGTRIGGLIITFNEDKTFSKITGKVVPMIRADTPTVAVMDDLVQREKTRPAVGKAVVSIDGESCWTQECNLGNLVTDSMVHCAYNHDKVVSNVPANQSIISVWHGGAFFPDHVQYEEPIRPLDIHTWLPYHNFAYLVKIRGAGLWYLLEQGATALQDGGKQWGQFLQVSNGIEVSYNSGRVSRVRVAMHDGEIPRFVDVKNNEEQEFYVVIPSIIHRLKSVFTDFDKYLLTLSNPDDSCKNCVNIDFDDTCLTNYIQALKVITHGFEERIFLDADSGGDYTCNKKTGLTVFLTLFIFLIIVGLAYAAWKYVILPRRANNNCL